MFLFSLAFTKKFNNPTGYQVNLPILKTQEDINIFLNSNEYSFILFESNAYSLSWMDYGIFKYQDTISFAAAPVSFAKQYGCENDYCLFAFHKNEPIEVPEWALNFPVQFANWLGQISHPNFFQIKTKETLRSFLSQIEDDCIFAIDQNSTDIPSFISKDEFIVFATSSAFKQYDISDIKPGYYYYRYSDRQILPYEEKSKKSPFIDVSDALASNKSYLAAYIYDQKQISEMQEGLNIMNQLSSIPQYSEKMDFIFNELDEVKNLTWDAHLR